MIDLNKFAAALELAADALRGTDAPKTKPAAAKKMAPEKAPDPAPATETPSNVVPLGGAAGMYDTAPATATAQPTCTLDALRAEATALYQRTGDATVIPDMLARYGVTGLKDLGAENYGALLADIRGAFNA